jgi:hypothetical protein
MLAFETSRGTFEVIDSGLVFLFEFFKFITGLPSIDGRLLTNEEDLGEMIFKVVREEIHPSTFPELLFDAVVRTFIVGLTYQDTQLFATLLPVEEPE